MAVNVWDGSTDGVWTTGANWSTAAEPAVGDEVVFDSTSAVTCDDGMLPSESGDKEYDLIHVKAGHTGTVGSAAEPLALGGGVAGFPIIIEGSGTYYIVCTDGTNAGSAADATLPLVIINNPNATVYLYSQDNDGDFVSTFTNVHLIAGTLNMPIEAMSGATGDSTSAVVTNLYMQPRSQQKSNATCTIGVENDRVKATAAKMNVYMANGTLTTDSGLATVHFQGGTINLGTDGGGGTTLDIDTLLMYNGTFAWNPNEDAAYIQTAHIYGGTITCSKTINEANTRVLGNGAGNDIYYYTGSKLNLDTGTGVVTVGTQLISMGGSLTLDSFTELGITNNPDVS